MATESAKPATMRLTRGKTSTSCLEWTGLLEIDPRASLRVSSD